MQACETSKSITIFIVLASLFLLPFSATAETGVTTDITTSTTWSLAGAPYIVETSITIQDGVTLTIEPGVEIRISDGSSITVSGTLTAEGTDSAWIQFTSNQATPSPGDWYGIKFWPGSSGSNLSHVICEYATIAISIIADALAESPTYLSPSFDNCILRYSSLDGAYISARPYQCYSGNALAEFNDCVFEENGRYGIKLSAPGPQIYYCISQTVRGNIGGHFTSCIIQGNNAGGIYMEAEALYVSGHYESGGKIYTDFRANRIQNNSGDGIRMAGDDIIISDFANNVISSNSGCGIYFSARTSSLPLVIANNTICFNQSNGIEFNTSDEDIFVYNNILTGNLSGIVCDEMPMPDISFNNVWNNTQQDYTGCARGIGDISYDPTFIDTSLANYHLNQSSPCIDAGDPDSVYELEPEPNGSRINMGAYGNSSEAAAANYAMALTVASTSWAVDVPGGSRDFDISISGTGPFNWFAVTDMPWAIVTEGAEGTSATGTVSVTCEENTGLPPRSGILTITSGGASMSPRYIEIIQAGTPSIALSQTNLDFGEVILGDEMTRSVTITNEGDMLNVTGISSNSNDFSVDTTPFNLDVGESRDILVTFTPSQAGQATGRVTLQSNDPDDPLVHINLTGEGIPLADIDVFPAQINLSYPNNDITEIILQVSNAGGTELAYELTNPVTTDPETAVYLDGTDDFIQIPGGYEKFGDFYNRAFTIEAWFQTTDSDGIIIGSGGQVRYWKLGISDGKVFFDPRIDSSSVAAFSDDPVNDGEWHHIAVVRYNYTSCRMYLDGAEIKDWMAMPTMFLHIYFDVFIGDDNTGTRFFNGTIDEVRVWSRALTEEEINTNMNKTLAGDEMGLAAYWNFDDPDPWQDASPYSNDGTAYGTPTTVISTVPIERKIATFDIDSGSLNGYESQDIVVTINTAGIEPGEYTRYIEITSNDPDEPLVTVPISITVTDGPEITVTPSPTMVPETGGTATFALDFTGSNPVGWSVFSNTPDWLTVVSPASGAGNGSFSADASVNHQAPRTGTLTIQAPNTANGPLTVQVSQGAFQMGDIDHSGDPPDLLDAILALKILADIPVTGVYPYPSDSIGLPEAIFILQTVAGLR